MRAFIAVGSIFLLRLKVVCCLKLVSGQLRLHLDLSLVSVHWDVELVLGLLSVCLKLGVVGVLYKLRSVTDVNLATTVLGYVFLNKLTKLRNLSQLLINSVLILCLLLFEVSNALCLLFIKLVDALCLIFELSNLNFLAFNSNLLFACSVLFGSHVFLTYCLCTKQLVHIATYVLRTYLDKEQRLCYVVQR